MLRRNYIYEYVWPWTQGPYGCWWMCGVHEELQSTETMWALLYTRILHAYTVITQQDWSVGTPCYCIEEKECSFPSSKKLYNSATSCVLNGVFQFSNVFILHSWIRPLRVSNGLQIEWNPLKSQTLGSFVLAMPSGELEDVSGNQQFWLWANPLIANSNWRMICVGVFIIKMHQACSVPPADFLLPVSQDWSRCDLNLTPELYHYHYIGLALTALHWG